MNFTRRMERERERQRWVKLKKRPPWGPPTLCPGVCAPGSGFHLSHGSLGPADSRVRSVLIGPGGCHACVVSAPGSAGSVSRATKGLSVWGLAGARGPRERGQRNVTKEGTQGLGPREAGTLWGTHGVLNDHSTGRQIGRSLPFVLVYSTGTRSSDSGEGDIAVGPPGPGI